MWNKRLIAAAIAALGVAGPLTSARAQSDVQRADRQEERREERQQDRREVRLDVPRNADGTIDTTKLAAEIRDLFQQGAREVRIRESGLSAQERDQLAQLARQLGAELGVERLRVRDEGNRLRIELRAERRDQVQRPERNERAERPERNERAERPERVERAERPERPERPERSGRGGG